MSHILSKNKPYPQGPGRQGPTGLVPECLHTTLLCLIPPQHRSLCLRHPPCLFSLTDHVFHILSFSTSLINHSSSPLTASPQDSFSSSEKQKPKTRNCPYQQDTKVSLCQKPRALNLRINIPSILINKEVCSPCHPLRWVGQGGLLPCASHGGAGRGWLSPGEARHYLILLTRESFSYFNRLIFRIKFHNELIFDPDTRPTSQKPLWVLGNRDTVEKIQFNKKSRTVHVGPPSLDPRPLAMESRLKLAL